MCKVFFFFFWDINWCPDSDKNIVCNKLNLCNLIQYFFFYEAKSYYKSIMIVYDLDVRLDLSSSGFLFCCWCFCANALIFCQMSVWFLFLKFFVRPEIKQNRIKKANHYNNNKKINHIKIYSNASELIKSKERCRLHLKRLNSFHRTVKPIGEKNVQQQKKKKTEKDLAISCQSVCFLYICMFPLSFISFSLNFCGREKKTHTIF